MFLRSGKPHDSGVPRPQPPTDYFSEEQLGLLGHELATQTQIDLPGFSEFHLIRRQNQNKQIIAAVYRSRLKVAEAKGIITPATEWLIDNFYLIDENIRQLKRDLSLRAYRQLPMVHVRNAQDVPYTMALARRYVDHSHCEVTADRLTTIVNGYQSHRPLLIGELWAIPSLLRFVLIEELRHLASRIQHTGEMRTKADQIADQILRAPSSESRQAILAAGEALADDNTFASHLLYRLRDSAATNAASILWLQRRLEARGCDCDEVLILEQNQLSLGTVRIGNIVRSLRAIADIDWTKWFTRVSKVDSLLRERSNFDLLDFNSQDRYRNAIERLARRSTLTEIEVTLKALTLRDQQRDLETPAKSSQVADIGFILIGSDRLRLEQAIGYRVSIKERLRRLVPPSGCVRIAAPIVFLWVIAAVCAFVILQSLGVAQSTALVLAALALLPASEAATGLFNTAASFLVAPARLVGFEFRHGIPDSAKTLVVIPCFISSRDGVDDLTRRLEVHYLANPLGEVYFALVSDWPDSPQEQTAHDSEVLAYASEQIEKLATRYAHDGKRRFFLLHRRRLFNPGENIWMGWERKRGKLMELNLLLRGDRDTSYETTDFPLPEGIQYVMTLDADTRIGREAVTKLVGKMAHPLNHPVYDRQARTVSSGYAIMQPRVSASLTTGEESSAFQRIFSVDRGLDPYVFTVSDTYQDLAGEGSFTGKGLYHVDAFMCALEHRFDQNTILSHDLLEGAIARCALVTDVELIEDFPVRYEVEASRQHRWARGDWQLLPFIVANPGMVNRLGRWKMFDNLRRSLVSISWLLACLLGWLVLPLGVALGWQVALVLTLTVSPTLAFVRGVGPGRVRAVTRTHLYAVYAEFLEATAQVLLRIIFIPHTAVLMVDAISRSLFRVYVSGRDLLQWRTAAQAHEEGHRSLPAYYLMMKWAIAAAILALLPVVLLGLETIVIAVPFGFFWLMAPYFAWLVSAPAQTEDRLDISAESRAELRRVARRTWVYFESFVNAEHHWLPPDNYQEDPEPVVAHRTSPTNVGLYLLAVVSARDFGWISLSETITKLERTLATIDQLEKHQGHLLNWYDTTTLAPLLPKYVSSVDSGNLAGLLVTVSSTCREWAEAPFAYLQPRFDGIADCIGVLAEELDALPDDRRTIRPLRQRLEQRVSSFRHTVSEIDREGALDSVRASDLSQVAIDVEKLAAELHHEIGSVLSRSVLDWASALTRTCAANATDAMVDQGTVEHLRQRLLGLADHARAIAFQMDFAFMFRDDRRLLAIGYRVADDALDEACYDLLASEARLSSFFAIAKGDLPTEHWFRLGRTITDIGSLGALISWSGSMFEYLMPPLIMQEQQGGILNQTNNLVVKRQIEYGRLNGIPWGLSEAAFNARDHQMNYQYTNFGVPSLGMKRGLGQDLVVAPYATLLASQYRPNAAIVNLRRLAALGARGPYGFHDAIDFTPSRLPVGESHVVVRNYMAHHHGMSILAVSNVVFHGRLRDRFHSDPVIEAAELLLQEKAPRDVPVRTSYRESETPVLGRSEIPGVSHRVIKDPAAVPPAVSLLSNGHYSLILTATGSSYAGWNGLAVTRWQPDRLDERWGSFLFLRDVHSGQWWSATSAPRRAAGEVAHTVFSDSKAEFHKTVGSIRSQVDVVVATEHDAEGRSITLFNLGDEDRFIEVTSYCEPVIARGDADQSHPAFSKMFIRTQVSDNGSVIYAERNKRRPDEPDMVVAHMVSTAESGGRNTQAETDRRRFIGRGRTLASAAAFDSDAVLSGGDGFTLDPILSVRRTVRVPAGKHSRLVYWTIAAPDKAQAELAVAQYAQQESFEREAMHAWTRSQIQLHHVGISLDEATVFQRLARYFVFPDTGLNAGADEAKIAPQSSLWALGISGDYPLHVVRIDSMADIEIVSKALRAQEYFRARGLLTDLVIVNEQLTSYAQELQTVIETRCQNARHRSVIGGSREHIFALRRDLMPAHSYSALMAAARAVFHARNGKFSTQLDRVQSLEGAASSGTVAEVSPWPRVATPRPGTERTGVAVPGRRAGAGQAPRPLAFWNGFGGFDTKAREYVVRLAPAGCTPHPWINVVANRQFGFHVSAEGAGFTWSQNSRDYQLTPWSNDPVINRPGEAFFVVDRDSKEVFSPLGMFESAGGATFEARHGTGYSVFVRQSDEIGIELSQIVDADDPVKISRLSITNRGPRKRVLRVYGYVEWVLGNDRAKAAPFIVSDDKNAVGALMASNRYGIEYQGRTAFFACNEPLSSYTCSRYDVLGDGTVWLPDAIAQARDLNGETRSHGDPCAALAVDIELEPGAEVAMAFLLGDCGSAESAKALLARQRKRGFADLVGAARSQWDGVLSRLQISTPDAALDLMVNTWLPYQSIACRIRARSAFYQASGAYGFRDQLQDTLAFLVHDPALARDQIIAAAGRQFVQGDVQHWWLPASGAGVRTMISDDVVWLAYGVACYVKVTGDHGILETPVPFLEGGLLEPGQHDAFFVPDQSDRAVSVYEHCVLALNLAIARTGAHGLPLILGGDWNDGMNRVGEAGRGESVWLGWLLGDTLHSFITLADARGDQARAVQWRDHLRGLQLALEASGWDGNHYRRGYYDDGSPLGSDLSDECRIDSIAQSWSVLSGIGDRQRATQAMDAVLAQLVDEQSGLIKLFTPPFEHTAKEPGYIKGYPPGVRENGGQYTHAATWVVYALATLGRGDDAYRCFNLLNPINHALDRSSAETYRVEPYVVAADVYAHGGYSGRGGWTWYTGSSGWLYRAAVEAILGIRREGNRLFVQPALPSAWPGYNASIQIDETSYRIRVDQQSGGVLDVFVNEQRIADPATGYALTPVATSPR
ncbi:MAG: glucoamylase family protein [Burkholderiaceae bacterium]